MKKILYCFVLSILLANTIIALNCANCKNITSAQVSPPSDQTPLLAIVIDDFGSYDRSGVKNMLMIEAPLTCAIMPNLDYSLEDMESIIKSGKEVILHMPMESHVHLPSDWYGPVFIKNTDSPREATKKLEDCLRSLPKAKGFNIHIGSGVSQNKQLMKAIIGYAKENNLFFLDSRTHENTQCENAAKEENFLCLGRDEFLEPHHDKSYAGVKQHIQNGINIAKQKGHAIIIGHVGAHGGENTAKAIKDMIKAIESEGIKLVTLSELNNIINSKTK